MDSKRHAIAALLEKAHEERMFPGCACALISKDSIEYLTYGSFTYEAGAPKVTTESLFDVASITKVVGPMSIAQMLIDEGVLSLEDKVSTYLPTFAIHPFKDEVLISHLLTYTVGHSGTGGSKSLITPGITPQGFADILIKLPLNSPPGAEYMYSNITAFLLTQVIEKVTGRRLDELASERIFTPLGMNTATFSPEIVDKAGVIPSEITEDRGEVRGFVHDESADFLKKGNISSGAAGLFASIQDIALFMQMVAARGVCNGVRFFSEEMVSLWTRDIYPELLPTHTPLGWGDLNNPMIDVHHRNIVVKGGFTGCFMFADLDQGVGLVFLSNRTYPKRKEDSSDFKKLKEDLMRAVLSPTV